MAGEVFICCAGRLRDTLFHLESLQGKSINQQSRRRPREVSFVSWNESRDLRSTRLGLSQHCV